MKRLLVILVVLIAAKGFTQPMACRLLHNVPASLKLICDSAHKVANNMDDGGVCIVQLVDSLRTRFIKTHETKYLVCLDSICMHCNEFVDDHFKDTLMFYQSFKTYIDYLYKNGDTMNCLEMNLEASFGFDDMEDPNDLFDAKKRLSGFIAEQERIYKFSDSEKAFIEFIKREAEALDSDE